VQGHTDNKGAAAYNKNLSDRRAKSVMKYLFEHGVETSRLASHGYGFERPLVDNSTEQNRALNRRVQFVRTEGVKEGCPKPSGG
jgi:outer membrane protein OmpA-like peptidoglycan-associated protein